jgi:hypothetical protein
VAVAERWGETQAGGQTAVWTLKAHIELSIEQVEKQIRNKNQKE